VVDLERVYWSDVRNIVKKVPAGTAHDNLVDNLRDYASAVLSRGSSGCDEEGRYLLAKFRTSGWANSGVSLKAEIDTLADNYHSLLTPGNYSPPFWEILLDTVTAESPTGEG
jgi:hypothetical protein